MAPKKKAGKFQVNRSMPVDSANEYDSPKSAQKSTNRTIAVLTTLCVFVSILACVVFLNRLGFTFTLPSKTISAGVTVAGVDIGGLTKEEAEEALAAVSDAYSSKTMIVNVLDQQLEISPSVSGAVLDVESVVQYARKQDTAGQMDISPYLTLDTESILNRIAEFGSNFPTDGVDTDSRIITETVDGEEQDYLEVTLGTAYYDFSADKVYEAIKDAYSNCRFTASYTCNRMDAAAVDLDALYAEHCYDAVEAVLDTETLEVTQSSEGYRFDLDSAKEALTSANPGDVLKFPFEKILPSMDTDTLKSMLFRDKLATYTAYQSSSANRATNLRLACEALDGLILNPGDSFSYNDTLGQRTPEKGYKEAAAYMNGETVQSYGGGICQPSSALYYCTLIADLEIVQRHCHTYPSSYVPFGMDATVSWGGPDFKFKNNTDFPIRIDAKADGGSVTITLVGTDTKDYYVKMEYEILGVTSPKVEYIEVQPGSKHKDGEVKSSGHTGYTVQSYKLKYSKETDELISREKEAYSVYSMQKKVVYKVVGEEKPTETEPTTPPTTEPKPTEPKPTETEPTTPPTTEPKPTEPKPTETEPTTPPTTEPKPTETEPKPTETEPKPTETKPAPTESEEGSDSETPNE